jgi:predicted adenylyl cyclase CyaB
MGLEKIITLEKERKEYTLGEFSICLDEIKNLGYFIEIESLNDDQQDKIELNELMKKFNISEEQIIHKGYVTMLLAQNNSPYKEYIVN